MQLTARSARMPLLWQVRVTIIFCGGYRLVYKHMLSFDGDGSADVQEHRVAISSKVMAAVERLQRLSRPLLSQREKHEPATGTTAGRNANEPVVWR